MPTDATAPPRPSGSEGAPARFRIETFTLGPFETNCYLVYPDTPDTPGRPCWIVDAGFGPAEMVGRVRELALRPAALLLTHAHVDHIAGVNEVCAVFPGLRVLIHAAEREWLGNPALNLSLGAGVQITARGPDGGLEDGQELSLAEGAPSWRVLHTPGHSPGGVTFFCEAQRVALVGDALFAGSVGRTDFPGSDPQTLSRSIRFRLYTLPDDTTIYPGHGPTSTIGREKRTNPFVRA